MSRDMPGWDRLSEEGCQFSGPAAGLLPWLRDAEVTDLLLNGHGSCFVERSGELQAVDSPFPTEESLRDWVDRIFLPLGKRRDARQPFLDGRLACGARVHVVFPPIAAAGITVSVRKRRETECAPLESFGEAWVPWLLDQIDRRKNVLLCGATGAGKTTLLSRLLERVPPGERILVLEESREIHPAHPHVLSLETRPAGPEGQGEVTLSDLVRQSLRMRPDRLILGECRGAECWDLLQVLHTGHRGSLCTLHANSARDGLRRFEALVLASGTSVPLRVVREWIASAVDAVVHVGREGKARKILEAVEVTGLEGEVYRTAPVDPEGPAGSPFRLARGSKL